MKTINVSDSLHNRLKNASEFCGVSIQNLVEEMLERDFSNAITVKEFPIENHDIKLLHEQLQDYIKLKNLKEGEFKITMSARLFNKNLLKIYHK